MEVKIWTYQEFPEYPATEAPEGTELIHTSGDETGSRYIHDVKYLSENGVELRLQILMPVSRNVPRVPALPPLPGRENMVAVPGTETKKQTKLPCIVYVKGSAWLPQDLYNNLGNYAKLAEKGYVVAEVEYRHSGIAFYPAQVIDARNAVRFMKKNADIFYVDPEQMFLGGDSSGGHTALMAAIRHNDDTVENAYPGWSGDVLGVIDLYGAVSFMREDGYPCTLNHHQADSPEGKLAGDKSFWDDTDLRREMSVEEHITASTEIAPVLIFHGTKDRTVNTRLSILLYEKLKECGKEVSLYLLEGADHGGPEFWTETTIGIMDRFMKEHLKK